MKRFDYNAFDSRDAIGNPASVFLTQNEFLSQNDKEILSVNSGFPISCFVDVLNNKAIIDFFAPNGQKETVCFHGTMAVLKMLKDNFGKSIKKIEIKNYQEIELIELENDYFGIKFKNNTKLEIVQNQTLIQEIRNNFRLRDEDFVNVYFNHSTNDIIVETSNSKIVENLSYKIAETKDFLIQNNRRAIMFFSLLDKKTVISKVLYVNLAELEDICCGSANISISKILFEKYKIKNFENIQPYRVKETGKFGGRQKVIYSEKEIILMGHVSKIEDSFQSFVVYSKGLPIF